MLRIVKLKTNKGRTLYAIQDKGWFYHEYVALNCIKIRWSLCDVGHWITLDTIASESLEEVQLVFERATTPPEKVTKIIPRKCNCK